MRVSEGSSRLSGQRASRSFSTRAMSPVLPLLILVRMPAMTLGWLRAPVRSSLVPRCDAPGAVASSPLPTMKGMTTDISPQDTAVPAAGAVVPEKPSLDGIEEKWVARWAAEDTYAFDRDAALRAPRDQTWSIDTPPPTASGRAAPSRPGPCHRCCCYSSCPECQSTPFLG